MIGNFVRRRKQNPHKHQIKFNGLNLNFTVKCKTLNTQKSMILL